MIGCNIERLRGNYAKRLYVREAQMTKTMSKRGQEVRRQVDRRPGGRKAERQR